MKIVLDNASLTATTPSARAARNATMATNGVAEHAKSLFCFGTDSPSALSTMTVRAATAPSKTSIKALKGENRTELKYSQFGCVFADIMPSMKPHALRS